MSNNIRDFLTVLVKKITSVSDKESSMINPKLTEYIKNEKDYETLSELLNHNPKYSKNNDKGGVSYEAKFSNGKTLYIE